METEGDNEERVYKSLTEIGPSVIHGAISTFLAVIVLSGSKSYIFVVFYKIWLAIIICGLFHGVILNPIILSVIGPQSNFIKLNPNEDKIDNVEEIIKKDEVIQN